MHGIWPRNVYHIWASIHVADGHLTIRSREISKPWNSGLYVSDHAGSWQAHWQQRCRDACQIFEQHAHYDIQSRGLVTYSKASVRLANWGIRRRWDYLWMASEVLQYAAQWFQWTIVWCRYNFFSDTPCEIPLTPICSMWYRKLLIQRTAEKSPSFNVH